MNCFIVLRAPLSAEQLIICIWCLRLRFPDFAFCRSVTNLQTCNKLKVKQLVAASCIFKTKTVDSKLKRARHEGVLHWFKLLVASQILDGAYALLLSLIFGSSFRQSREQPMNYQADHAARHILTFCQTSVSSSVAAFIALKIEAEEIFLTSITVYNSWLCDCWNTLHQRKDGRSGPGRSLVKEHTLVVNQGCCIFYGDKIYVYSTPLSCQGPVSRSELSFSWITQTYPAWLTLTVAIRIIAIRTLVINSVTQTSFALARAMNAHV